MSLISLEQKKIADTSQVSERIFIRLISTSVAECFLCEVGKKASKQPMI
jgi:hypothetical protein